MITCVYVTARIVVSPLSMETDLPFFQSLVTVVHVDL